MTFLDKHGGLLRDGLPLTYPDRKADLTLISFISSKEDVDFLFPFVRWDLVSRWMLVVQGPTKLTSEIYHPKIKWSVEWMETVDKELPSEVLSLPIIGFVSFHLLESPIKPEFWGFFEHLMEVKSFKFEDVASLSNVLFSSASIATASKFDSWHEVFENIKFEQVSLPSPKPITEQLSSKINVLTIDTTETYTPLCYYAGLTKTDKSCHHNRLATRHSYTGLYHLLLRHLRKTPIVFAEIGVLYDASVSMWRQYFHPQSTIIAMDHDMALLKTSSADIKCFIDVHNEIIIDHSLASTLERLSRPGYDVILDDSSHTLRGQLHLIRSGFSYLNPGGILIIEDVFCDIPVNHFRDVIDSLVNLESADLYLTNHQYSNNFTWNNDSVLVLRRSL
jgi:predicted O-methyltransferase YrrM